MIPKKIHYCWFGGNPIDELGQKCLASWKKYCPDYEIIEWNESNFDINSNSYVKEAYEAKKWAFVTDYVRLYALFNYGGVYMDTDAELIMGIDAFLNEPAFSGFESTQYILTAIMGAEKGSEWIGLLLRDYDGRHFKKDDGSYDLTTNVKVITELTVKKYGIELNNQFQRIDDTLTIYPSDYFCPKDWQTGKINITENTYCIHHFNASWYGEKEKIDMELWKLCNNKKISFIEKYGKEKGIKKYLRWKKRWKLKQYLKDGGIKLILHKVRAKLKTAFGGNA